MPTITLPYKFTPRPYQLAILGALNRGAKQASKRPPWPRVRSEPANCRLPQPVKTVASGHARRRTTIAGRLRAMLTEIHHIARPRPDQRLVGR